MAGWTRYAVAIAAGFVGAVVWGGLVAVLGTDGFSVIGAVLIMACALAWAAQG